MEEVKWPLFAVAACVLMVGVVAGFTQAQPLALGSRLASVGKALALDVGLSVGAPSSSNRSEVSSATTPLPRTMSCGAEGSDGYQQCTFADRHGHSLNFLLHVPATYDPLHRYPLVLVLHGGGERASEGMRPAAARALLCGAPYVKVWVDGNGPSSVQSRWPSFIVVPQLAYSKRWAYALPAEGSFPMAATPTAELQMTKDVVDDLQQQYGGVDPNRLYITGISLGGYGTWDAIERWPSYFAAAVPVSGAGDPSKAGELKHLPIWVFHGGADKIVPISGSRDMVEAIRAAGGDPRYTEYPGAHHDIWARVYDTAQPAPTNLFDWLFAQHEGGSSLPKLTPENAPKA